MDFAEWQADAKHRTGHLFELYFLPERFTKEQCVNVINEVVQGGSFMEVLADVIRSKHADDLEFAKADLSDLSDRARLVQFATRARLSTSTPEQRHMALIESAVMEAFHALDRFNGLPKRTPTQHRKHFERIAKLAAELDALVSGEDYYGIGGYAGDLHRMAEVAAETAREPPPLDRPTAKNADRTYVAKEVAQWFLKKTGRLRHEAVASLVNAMFSDKEVIDAVYIQSLTRVINLEDDED